MESAGEEKIVNALSVDRLETDKLFLCVSLHHLEPLVDGQAGGVEGVDVTVGFGAADGQAGDEEGVGAVGQVLLQQVRINHDAELRTGAVAERGQAEHEIIEYETAVEERAVGISGGRRAEKEHLARTKETEIFAIVGAAFFAVVAANALVLEDAEADLFGAGLPFLWQRVGRILVTMFGRYAGIKGGEIIGAQCFQRVALQEVKFPRLGVLGTRGATGGFHELADGFHRDKVGLELANGVAGMHDFEGGIHRKRREFSASGL